MEETLNELLEAEAKLTRALVTSAAKPARATAAATMAGTSLPLPGTSRCTVHFYRNVFSVGSLVTLDNVALIAPLA